MSSAGQGPISPIAFPPSLAASAFSTAGYALWVRARRGLFPSRSVMGKQFLLSFAVGFAVSYQYIFSQRKSREALARMMRVTEKRTEVRSRDSLAEFVSVEEYDEATGEVAEVVTAKLMEEALMAKN